MRLTYTNILDTHFRNIGKSDQATDTILLADFNANLGLRYQLILSNISSYINETPRTDITVASSKYSTGTALCTNGSTTVTGTDTVWTSDMVGSFFMITDKTITGNGYLYKVAAVGGATTLTLNRAWMASTIATSTYSIETPTYYAYPPGMVSMDTVSITIGSYTYTLSPIYDQSTWSMLNAMQIQPTAIPQFYFPRKDDFGIWPVPSDTYTINFNTFDRDRNLSVADYTTGTALPTYCDATIVGTGTTWTQAMVGRWFSITDTTVPGQGYWYRIASFTDATHLELNRPWVEATAATSNYRIGESPEIPEEAHVLLAYGTASDYYAGLRNDIEKATWWDNMFYTGSGTNSSRDKDDKNIMGGLIGLIKNYENRDRSNLIYKVSRPKSPYWKVFGTTLS
jgi:hypothetical protein